MREYRFTDSLARDTVDLTEYEETIKKSVAQVKPGAVVHVFPDKYTIDNISRSESVMVGRLLSKTALAEYCIRVQISRLFCGHEIEEEC